MEYAICTIIKNEHRYLKEWIEYNLKIGFTAIHLFEDLGSDSHKEIAECYNNVFLHSFAECARTDYADRDWKQVDMMRHFAGKYHYDWVAFIDPDEYIRFDKGWSLERLCKHFNTHIYLQWRMIGASGHINRPEGSVQENYHNSEAEYHNHRWNMKSLACMSKQIEIRNCHKVKHGVFTNGCNANKGISREKAWIDHYFTKSWEDWVERFEKRGDVVEGNRKIEEFFRYNRGFDLNVITPYVKGLNLGCGKNKLKGWLNTDLKDELFPMDATKPLPFDNDSFMYVYSEHMVEHLAEEDGRNLFAEIYRVLKDGGVFRLALPTQEMFERVTNKYLQWHFDKHGEGERTLENLKQRFSTMWGHKKIYSVRELTDILTAIGFSVKVCEIGKSEHDALRGIEHHGDIIGEYNNRIETTIIEATK